MTVRIETTPLDVDEEVHRTQDHRGSELIFFSFFNRKRRSRSRSSSSRGGPPHRGRSESSGSRHKRRTNSRDRRTRNHNHQSNNRSSRRHQRSRSKSSRSSRSPIRHKRAKYSRSPSKNSKKSHKYEKINKYPSVTIIERLHRKGDQQIHDTYNNNILHINNLNEINLCVFLPLLMPFQRILQTVVRRHCHLCYRLWKQS